MMSLSVTNHTVNLTLATVFIDNYLLTYNISCGEEKSAVFDAARDQFLTIFQNNQRILRSADPGTVKPNLPRNEPTLLRLLARRSGASDEQSIVL